MKSNKNNNSDNDSDSDSDYSSTSKPKKRITKPNPKKLPKSLTIPPFHFTTFSSPKIKSKIISLIHLTHHPSSLFIASTESILLLNASTFSLQSSLSLYDDTYNDMLSFTSDNIGSELDDIPTITSALELHLGNIAVASSEVKVYSITSSNTFNHEYTIDNPDGEGWTVPGMFQYSHNELIICFRNCVLHYDIQHKVSKAIYTLHSPNITAIIHYNSSSNSGCNSKCYFLKFNTLYHVNNDMKVNEIYKCDGLGYYKGYYIHNKGFYLDDVNDIIVCYGSNAFEVIDIPNKQSVYRDTKPKGTAGKLMHVSKLSSTLIGVAVMKGALRVYDYIQKQLLYEITVNSTIGEYYLHHIEKEYIITNKAKNEIALVCVNNTKKVLGTFPIAIAHMFDKGIALQDGRYIIASQKAFVVITPNALNV